MTSYGFRLYTFQIKQERARTRIHPLIVEKESASTWRYQDHLVKVAQEHLNTSVAGLPPRLDGGEREQDLDEAPVFQLVTMETVGTKVMGVFRHGRPSGHGLALPKASKSDTLGPVDISDYSPTRDYRFVLWFPEAGDIGMMAVEAIAGACPTRYLAQWARWWSQFASDKAPDDKPEPWFNMVAKALGDAIQVNEFIEHSTLLEVVLVAGARGSGRLRRAEEFRITSTLDVQGKTKALHDLSTVLTAGESDEELAERLAKLFGRNVEEIDLDDGWIVLDTEYGQHSVSPSRIPDVFTYPIGEQSPDDDEFRDRTAEKAKALSPHVNGVFDFD